MSSLYQKIADMYNKAYETAKYDVEGEEKKSALGQISK